MPKPKLLFHNLLHTFTVLLSAKQGGADAPVSCWHDLKSPVDFSKAVGRIRVQTQSATLHVRDIQSVCQSEASSAELDDEHWNACGMSAMHVAIVEHIVVHMPKQMPPAVQHLEKQFWGRALKIADLNADGSLELHEFTLLMQVCDVSTLSILVRWSACSTRIVSTYPQLEQRHHRRLQEAVSSTVAAACNCMVCCA